MNNARLLFVRHGQTDWNLARRLQSRTDVPLNDTGRHQAQRIRDLLDSRDIGFVRIVTSPMMRARETAEIIAGDRPVVIIVEPAFRELDAGEYEGREESELRRELGTRYDDWRTNCFLEAAPGGETMPDVMERVRGPLLALAAEHDGNRLIVGHQAVNAAMKAVLTGRSDPASLRGWMQANDEVDVWDPADGGLVERMKPSVR